MKLANVTGQSAQEVSSQMTAIWNNFDDGSHKLEYYADAITALGAGTASSSAEIASGLSKFASVAKTVGLSYDKAAASIATVVATTRQSAEVVGTAFKTLLARIEGLKLGETLEDGTDLNKYSKALETIGVNIKDQSGNLKEMDTILDELGTKWQTLSKDQ
jgi:TP901 family phage tail tape measure protein